MVQVVLAVEAETLDNAEELIRTQVVRTIPQGEVLTTEVVELWKDSE
jgi:hypothetical protein